MKDAHRDSAPPAARQQRGGTRRRLGPGANSISARRRDGSCPHAAASRRRTRVVGAFSDGQSALNPVGRAVRARLIVLS
jgi:hypothetical protein